MQWLKQCQIFQTKDLQIRQQCNFRLKTCQIFQNKNLQIRQQMQIQVENVSTNDCLIFLPSEVDWMFRRSSSRRSWVSSPEEEEEEASSSNPKTFKLTEERSVNDGGLYFRAKLCNVTQAFTISHANLGVFTLKRFRQVNFSFRML